MPDHSEPLPHPASNGERPDGYVRVRHAGPADAATLAAVHCAAALAAYADIFPATAGKPSPRSLAPSWVALLTEPTATVLAATIMAGGSAGRIVGCVAVHDDATVPTRIILARLYVHPRWWRHGIATVLHDLALTIARERGADAINLWVLTANTIARDLYERRGWRLVPDRSRTNRGDPTILDVLYQSTLTATPSTIDAGPARVGEDLRDVTGDRTAPLSGADRSLPPDAVLDGAPER